MIGPILSAECGPDNNCHACTWDECACQHHLLENQESPVSKENES